MNDATALNMTINQGNSFNISATIIYLYANTRMKTTAFKVVTIELISSAIQLLDAV
jgi:hypothetical protein